jgi:diguanylate cyclase (GGDEF)-like protein
MDMPGGVTRVEDMLPPDEQARLDECAQEPIHIPGAVQPHGVLLAVDPVGGDVVQASANCGRLLGREPSQVLGRPLVELLNPAAVVHLRAAWEEPSGVHANPHLVHVGERAFDAIVHMSTGVAVLELEPAAARDDGLLPALHAALARLSSSTTIGELRASATREVRALTGFDRVMVYHFHRDGHGEVVAEDRVEQLEPYLGLHYPASDIPAQARRLYVLQPSRLIVTSEQVAAPLLTAGGTAAERTPLDLSLAELRSVSPHHLQFLRNMGVGASMSFSLVRGGELVGMISCNHREPRAVSYLVRRACDILAQQVVLQSEAMEQTARLTRELDLQQHRARLVEQMTSKDDVAAGLVTGDLTVLDVVSADGVTVRLDGRLTSVGHAPADDDMEAAVALLTVTGACNGDGSGALVSDALSTDMPEIAALLPAVAGLVVVPFGGDGDYLAWFRREVVQTVDWLGDQAPDNRATPLSPRNSFHLWRQSVSGRSLPWDETEVQQAAELRRDVDNVLLRRAEARLAHLGLHDALTGLPNRRLLMDRLEHALSRHARGVPVALLFVDLDRFKLVNDSFGHDVGDQLIIDAAGRMTAVTRATDTVARLGGDEFVVLCEDTDITAATQLANRIVTAFQAPVQVDDLEVHITASVGITTAQEHHRPADLLREADSAMYLSKDEGRNRSSRFEAGLRYQALRRLDVEQALQHGLARGELALHFQPIVEVADGRLLGVEALLRWDRPGHGWVAPDEFIPLAEDTGFIVPLGEWVLAQALGQLSSWRRAGLVPSGFTVSVNVSPRQLLDPELVRTVQRLVKQHELPPSALTLEITETTLMSERSAMTDAVTALSELGVALSIDDFGTGYSSLSYLRYLPVRQLKVDRSFVASVADSPRDRALVAAVVGLSHEFGMKCVAEGVETAAQLSHLKALGCDCAQGYLLGRPVPADVLTSTWRERGTGDVGADR